MFTFLGELFDDSFFSLKSSTVQDEGKLGVKVVVGFPFGSIFVVRVHNTTPWKFWRIWKSIFLTSWDIGVNFCGIMIKIDACPNFYFHYHQYQGSCWEDDNKSKKCYFYECSLPLSFFNVLRFFSTNVLAYRAPAFYNIKQINDSDGRYLIICLSSGPNLFGNHCYCDRDAWRR
jgi:hypothetical protein